MPFPSALSPADLATITAFAGLPDATHVWLLAHGEIRTYTDGEVVIEPGAAADYLMAIVHGGVQFYQVKGSQREPMFRAEAGQVTGVLPYSRLRIVTGLGLAVGDTQLYVLHRDQFPALEQISPELTQRLVAVMNDRSRDQVRAQERDDKLRALGKLSAGLAHELNNPAAAIARAAQALSGCIATRPRLLLELVQHCPSPEALSALVDLACQPRPAPRVLSALQRSNQEDELADWLETQGITHGYRLAPALLEAGLDAASLAPVASLWPAAARSAAFTWLEGQLTAAALIQDVQEAGGRISKLVSDVKTYSHMDRDTAFDLLDLRSGLHSTLNMLGHQLQQKNIEVEVDFPDPLPNIRGQVGSLNQVWTNLIDNAIDALPAQGGRITLRIRPNQEFVCVYITDNGPGIPPAVLPHIFEPFYTTKQAGDGSGLGLDIAQRIIRQHNGRLEVSSRPGHTEFCAWLPANAQPA